MTPTVTQPRPPQLPVVSPRYEALETSTLQIGGVESGTNKSEGGDFDGCEVTFTTHGEIFTRIVTFQQGIAVVPTCLHVSKVNTRERIKPCMFSQRHRLNRDVFCVTDYIFFLSTPLVDGLHCYTTGLML
ncbi:hypothetical protein M8C21_033834 [Ambrosia artemisiifolia]|uniref:Uncharacterized protein n=1 Tax=Ambrosia artemisiifolia TaxID=4212 RepID=A0AAD5GWF6_AMBAR|nr:hypothetical protein M8C21_033834 [Ambrosia artemisiifolia]